jgi:putative ABC transport system permease protein
MLRNNLKIAYRNLRKQKVFSFINLFGLTVGLSCFLLIALYIFDELTYDGFHKKADSIYRVVETNPHREERKPEWYRWQVMYRPAQRRTFRK